MLLQDAQFEVWIARNLLVLFIFLNLHVTDLFFISSLLFFLFLY